MERRVALTAACTSSICLAVGTVSYAAVGGVSILGFGGSATPHAAHVDPLVVKHFQTIDDIVVVVTTTAPLAADDSTGAALADASEVAAAAASPAPALRRPGARTGPGTTASPVAPSDDPSTGTTSPQPVSTSPSGPSGTQPEPNSPASSNPASTPDTASATTLPPSAVPTTAAPTTAAPATTAPSPTTTVRPPGVPSDWPADQPIPPMPANCKKPQLEDNGVWNCEH